MRRLTKGQWAAAAVAVVAVAEYALAAKGCGGGYVYPLDDTYIHLAMARCLAQYGTWGVEAGQPAFCSSSPLWTLLLAGIFRMFGAVESLPWCLALGFNMAMAVVICRFLSKGREDWLLPFGGTLAVALSGPFVCTTALGMEHALHGLLVLSAVLAAVGMAQSGKGPARACLFAAAATVTRYESLFLFLPLGLGMGALEAWVRWRDRRNVLPVRALSFSAAAVLPVLAYGAWALAEGGHFLPNSLLFKGHFHSLSELLGALTCLLGTVREGCGFLYLLALSLLVTAALRPTPLVWRVVSLSVVVAIVGQMLFADVGQLCRYEAYLTVTGAFAICASLAGGGVGRMPEAGLPLAVYGVTALVFLSRAVIGFNGAIRASSDIRSQQVVVTRLLSELPEADKGCVAINDLGYAAWRGRFPFLDLWGLGSQDAAELRLRQRGVRHGDDYADLFRTHGVKYVVVFESWYPRGLMPEGTIDVARLVLKGNTICGSDTVVFRATTEAAADGLRKHLRERAEGLPARATLKFCW